MPSQTISSGTQTFSDPNALAASNVIINGSASVTFNAVQCIDLQPGFHATAGTAGTTFHAWLIAGGTVATPTLTQASGISLSPSRTQICTEVWPVLAVQKRRWAVCGNGVFLGMSTVVTERPVVAEDFLATVALALGIDIKRQNHSNVGRPIRIVEPTAKPIPEVLS